MPQLVAYSMLRTAARRIGRCSQEVVPRDAVQWRQKQGCVSVRGVHSSHPRKMPSGTPSTVQALLDHEEFARINREMQQYDETREHIIKRSRGILKSSKHAIYSLHRGDQESAQVSLEMADELVAELVPMATSNPSLRSGALSSSLEEYAEARCFAHYLTTRKLLSLRAIPHLDTDEYLGGVADFTGELTRYAVVRATARDEPAVQSCRAMVEAISGELIQFDFRNGPLRKKYDAVKYNLRKLENTLYELSLIQASGRQLQLDSTHDEPPASVRDPYET